MMNSFIRLFIAQALFIWPFSSGIPEDPPSFANSTVSYVIPTKTNYNYAEVIHKSLIFYHAQRSGKLGPNRRLAWRGDSCLKCIGPKGEDLTGGYYEASNTMKWGLPLAWTITQLAFNVYAFPDGFKAVKEFDEALDAVKWGADYLVNCISGPDQFVGQLGVSSIGDIDIDFGYYGPPEEYDRWVPLGIKQVDGIAYINSTNPSSEILGEAAAALAATSIVFASKDKDYSTKLLGHAVDLYTRAITYPGTYMNSTIPNMQNAKAWYPSSIYTDELAWAAAWLYVSTNDKSYLTAANKYIELSLGHDEYSWDEKLPGVYTLLFMSTKENVYKRGVEEYFTNFWPKGDVKQTAKGLVFLYSWGSLSYAANIGFLMMAYSKTIGYTNTKARQPVSFAAQQLNYMLGDSGRSFVVGFGQNPPVRPYHKSSYNSFIDYPLRGEDMDDQEDDFDNSKIPNRFILYGALEGGPAWNDTYQDDHSMFQYSDKRNILPRVSQDYNAAFTGLNAAMIEYYGTSNFKLFSDCGLNLGWTHRNASNPPTWPKDDCYHTCATGC